MSYYAKFESHSGQIFRLDTRIYLRELPSSGSPGQCVAAVVGKNPGSAKPSRLNAWDKLELDGDNLLPTVRKRFLAAYKKAEKEIPYQAFVQVWNLFYLCNKHLEEALRTVRCFDSLPRCSSEGKIPNIVWFVWGGSNKKLDSVKKRFQEGKWPKAFFCDKEKNCEISLGIPSFSNFARHTQGLKKQPVVDYLAEIL